MTKQSSFVPSSFQTPNAYVDYVMPYLTGEEYKVLLYATRRILGFQKRQDRISLSQFTDGTINKKGKVLDRGTGLSVETVKKSLASLVAFGLMVRVEGNDPRTNEGTLWSLQWNGRKVAWKALEEREEKRSEAARAKMTKARSMRQTPPNGIEGAPPNGIEGTPPNGIETQYTEETQGNTNEDEAAQALAQISKAYEAEIGLITAFIADELQDAANTYPLKWVLDAIHEAAVQNKRGWKYCLAILKRWKEQGNQEPAKPITKHNGRKQTNPNIDDGFLADLEAKRERLRAEVPA